MIYAATNPRNLMLSAYAAYAYAADSGEALPLDLLPPEQQKFWRLVAAEAGRVFDAMDGRPWAEVAAALAAAAGAAPADALAFEASCRHLAVLLSLDDEGEWMDLEELEARERSWSHWAARRRVVTEKKDDASE